MDFGVQYYADIEEAFKAFHKDLWARTQDSWRWKLFRYNNRQHNTLTEGTPSLINTANPQKE